MRRARFIWMGGAVPLGYRVEDRVHHELDPGFRKLPERAAMSRRLSQPKRNIR